MGLKLKLLGEFAVRDGAGASLSLPTRKTRALLGYLAVNADRPQPRERLMALLWSDRGERQARQSLNQALLAIRRLGDADGAALFDSDGERVMLRSDAVDCDVQRLRSLVDENPAGAAALYDGPFLDGLSVPDPAFEDWLLATRTELHALACDALEAAAGSEDATVALDCARRLVALDPLREDAHRRLMQLLHRSGDRTGALRQYQACAEILQRELQVEPDVATKALFEEVRQASHMALQSNTLSNAGDTAPDVPADSAGTDTSPSASSHRRRWRRTTVAAIVSLLVGGGFAVWYAPSTQPINPAPPQSISLPSPEIPSIAVLPFKNLSNDPAQEYFSDGTTEDLITDLSKVSGLFVIAHNSAFAFKKREMSLREVGKEPGVRFVLEGSVRRAAGQIRINAQLVDTTNGRHVWGERFDGGMADVFALQDAVNRKIVSALAVSLTADDRKRLETKESVTPEAYDVLLRGIERLNRFNRIDNIEAREFFRKAIAIDPGYARAYANLAWTYSIEVNENWSNRPDEAIGLAEKFIARALALNENNAMVHLARCSLFIAQRNYDAAIRAGRKAVELRPNHGSGYAILTPALLRAGELDEALESIHVANRLNPISNHIYKSYEGQILFLMGRYAEAVPFLEASIRRNPAFDRVHLTLAAAYGQLGETAKAEWSAGEALTLRPDISLAAERQVFKRQQDRDRYIEGLRRAGLPE